MDYPPSVHLVSGVVVHIHLHLSDVLVGEVAGFQINPHKAFQNVVAEHQINVKMLSIQIKMLLPYHKGEPAAQLQEEFCKWLINACSKLDS